MERIDTLDTMIYDVCNKSSSDGPMVQDRVDVSHRGPRYAR